MQNWLTREEENKYPRVEIRLPLEGKTDETVADIDRALLTEKGEEKFILETKQEI